MRLWSRKLQVLGSKEPLLTNRVRENFTHGSVGGGGSDPAPYPAVDGGIALLFQSSTLGPAATELYRSAEE